VLTVSLSAADASPLPLTGCAHAPPIKGNGADCDSQFWREQASSHQNLRVSRLIRRR